MGAGNTDVSSDITFTANTRLLELPVMTYETSTYFTVGYQAIVTDSGNSVSVTVTDTLTINLDADCAPSNIAITQSNVVASVYANGQTFTPTYGFTGTCKSAGATYAITTVGTISTALLDINSSTGEITYDGRNESGTTDVTYQFTITVTTGGDLNTGVAQTSSQITITIPDYCYVGAITETITSSTTHTIANPFNSFTVLLPTPTLLSRCTGASVTYAYSSFVSGG